MEARQKNITTTLPHVNRTLTDPAAGGCRPRAVPASAEVHPYLPARIHYTSALAVHTPCTTPSRCHGQRAPTHRHTARAHPLHRRPRAVTANAHPLTNTPPHRQCVHAKHWLTPAAIRRRTRRGRRTMRCSKTCTAQTDSRRLSRKVAYRTVLAMVHHRSLPTLPGS